ncbi:MAG: 50S ribosomal protein L29 [Bacteroidota bacterium]
MASKKFQELQDSTVEELYDLLSVNELDYQKLTFDHAIKGLDNPLELRALRRDVARIKTEIRRRELAEYSPEGLEKRSKIRARRKRNK